ncbi:hypothetical protein BGX38DRAFT_1139092 [Terfezia claveryi]|nr:hypothetical protein BGX38DRAFT_1139092 [Terfezia claveryi]
MRLQAIAVFGILQTMSYVFLAAPLVERQAGPMIAQNPSDKPSSPTSTPGSNLVSPPDPSSPMVRLPVPEAPKDGVYPISLIGNMEDEWSYPVMQVMIGAAKVPIRLGVSIHSNETWLRHSSTGVCPQENQCPILESDKLVQENGIEKNWDYTGQNGVMVSGNQYKFSSFEPSSMTTVRWKLENFTVGVAWMENARIFMGKDNGTLVIGGYLPAHASGDFTDISTGGNGVIQFNLQSLTIKGDRANLLKNIMATIDPGLPDIIIPKSVQESLISNENTKWATIGDKFQFGTSGPNEGSRPSFVFDLGDGVQVEMSEESYTLAKEPRFATYHLAQANVGNTDINNPTAITALNSGQGEALPPKTNNDFNDPNTNSDKTSSSSGANNSASGKRNTGIIIGGVVAGLVILALIFGVILCRHRRSQRQINEIGGFMGSGKHLPEVSDSEMPPAAVHRSTSPPNFNQEDTHLMEGYPVQRQHPPGSRGSIFREEMNTPGPTLLPPTVQYHYEDYDHLGGLHGPSSRRSRRRDQDLVRTESIISTTDVDVPTVERSTPCVPRLPMYCTRPGGSAL